MRKWNNKKLYLVLTLILPILLVGLLNNSKTTTAQPQYTNGTFLVNSDLPILEFSEDSGMKNNASSINITLPSSTWNLTQIELNFTNIKMGKEVVTVEDEGEDLADIYKKRRGCGVEINISEPTLIFGAYIYGFMLLENEIQPFEDVSVQIQGYLGATNEPDGIPLRSTSINMGTTLKWYFQEFSSPISLSQGQYYLVINGTNLKDDETTYYWRLNSSRPGLHTSECWLNLDLWKTGVSDQALLYKLNQRIDRSYNPEDINMSVEVDGIDYYVSNGTTPNTGNITIPNLNFSPGTENLYLPIENNKSIELLLNFSYTLKQKNLFLSDASAIIKEGFQNYWSVTPEINRTMGNYSFQFEYTKSWENLNIFRDSINITGNYPDVKILGSIIYVYNQSIPFDASWNITAYSSNIDYTVYIPTTTYEANQNIYITVNPPISSGNLTFILVDPFGYEEFIDEESNPSGEVEFSYPISPNPFEGQWKAYIIWNNQTDMGLNVLIIQIGAPDDSGGNGDIDTTVITGLDPQQVFFIALIIIIGVVGALTSYQAVKRHNIKKEQYRQKIYNKYMDTLNLNYIMISDKKSGLNIYEQFISGKKMDPTLVSGFLQAIKTFGIELTGSEEQSQSLRLEFQKSKILMSEFKDFRIVNIFEESPSKDFMDSLKPLSIDIDKYYGKSIKNFDGNLSKFKGMKELLERHLLVALVYPLKVVEPKTLKLDAVEKNLVKKALDVMKKKNSDYFYVSYLLSEKEYNVKNAEKILKLIEKKVFRPVG